MVNHARPGCALHRPTGPNLGGGPALHDSMLLVHTRVGRVVSHGDNGPETSGARLRFTGWSISVRGSIGGDTPGTRKSIPGLLRSVASPAPSFVSRKEKETGSPPIPLSRARPGQG